MFNQSAANFERRLNNLEYKVPNLIEATLQRRLAKAEGDLRVLDAGCGTGLCAPFLRSYSCQLTGVDLSAGMLEKARSRKLYDELVEAELTSYLVQQIRAFDLIVFADTLCYFGDLTEIIAATAGALRPNGMLVFLGGKAAMEERFQGISASSARPLQPFRILREFHNVRCRIPESRLR